MKKIIYLCVVISFNFHMVGQRQSEQPPQIDTICYSMEKHLSFTYNNTQIPVTAGWIYNNYYSDEFNGSVLDYNKWMCLDHYYHPNNNVIGYLEENVSVSNGRLVLSAKYDEEPQIYTSFGNNPPTSMNFNSGSIQSYNYIRYGYYEIECYLPQNHHYRPCFWTVGGDQYNYDEIDVFEIHPDYNSPYIFLQNEYSNLDRPGVSLTKQIITCSDSITGKMTRFGVEVLPYELVFYINGDVSSRLVYNRDYSNENNIFTCTDITRTIPMRIILSFTFNPVNGNMPQPDEDFAVEYFRCYKLARGSINTYNPSVFTPSAESRKVYPNIVLGGNGHTALINTSTAVWAEQSIVFDTGFELSSGVSFSARIINHGSENPATSPLYIINNPNECF